MLIISSFCSCRIIIRIGKHLIFIRNLLISFCIKLYSIKIFVYISCYLRISKGIFIHEFTWVTPFGIGIHQNFFWIFFLSFKRFFHLHPLHFFLSRNNRNKKYGEEKKKKICFHNRNFVW